MKAGKRKTVLILLAGLSVFVTIYYLVLLSPALTRGRALEHYIEKKEDELAGMLELKSKQERFKERRSRAEKWLEIRGKDFTLLSFLEGVSREAGISERIQYMKPLRFQENPGPLRPEGIEMSLDRIDIKQLTALLFKIECSEKLLNIKKLKIQCASCRTARYLKVTLRVHTYVFGEKTGS